MTYDIEVTKVYKNHYTSRLIMIDSNGERHVFESRERFYNMKSAKRAAMRKQREVSRHVTQQMKQEGYELSNSSNRKVE